VLSTLYIPEEVEEYLYSFIKGASSLVQAGAQAEREIEDSEAARKRRKIRASVGNKEIQKGGLITVADARHKIERRIFTELEQAQRVVARHAKAEKMKEVVALERIAINARVTTRKSNAELKRVVVTEKKRKREEKVLEKEAATQARLDQLALLIDGLMPHEAQEEDGMPLEDILA
jgi:hypothetical protein